MLFYLKNITTKYGSSHITYCSHYPAHYTRGATKINVILAVEAGPHIIPASMDGSVKNSQQWKNVTTYNCNQFVFGNFVNILLSNIKQHPTLHNIDDERIVLWDNFSAHKTPYFLNIIQDCSSNNGSIVVDCPPYRSRLAPIEYIFCKLTPELSRWCTKERTGKILSSQIMNKLYMILFYIKAQYLCTVYLKYPHTIYLLYLR